jgi:hypothetical protein
MGSFVKISTIEQATATAGPGDVIALTAENYVSSTSTTFWVYGQRGRQHRGRTERRRG